MIAWSVATYVLLLGVAVGGSGWAWAIWRRFRLPFLRPYAFYVTLCFAHAILNFVGETFVPLAVGPSTAARGRVYALVDLGTIPLLAGIFLTVLLWVSELLGRAVSRVMTWLFVALEVVFLSAFLAAIVTVFGSDGAADGVASAPAAIASILVLDLVLFALAAGAVLALLFAHPGEPQPYRASIARGLGLRYAACFAVVAFVLLGPSLPLAPGTAVVVVPTLVLLVNVPALTYLQRTLGRIPLEPPEASTDEAALAALARSARISERELDVVRLVVMGLDNRGIGERLFISPKTVKNHVGSIYAKTGVRNRVQLANLLRRHAAQPDRR
jgi:DNA-binding CsgD family transcriptional regulator